jgi:cyclophilin family peptidyl-prolyl cis-trans isomerase
MELDAAHAPRNARNFAGLVRDHFYDGLTFHRIVPGFVVQGGDPRGDGTGGADGLVACEPNDLPYREGTVGMALSGPDTGSSQFFITLAPAPHLEGRYTAFARVIEGMDVARALEPGDHIKSARLE